MPVVPPAPATFSTTICCPSVRDMCSPTMRATMSVGPPAANGTIIVIGRAGHVWACAPFPARTSAAAAAKRVFLTGVSPKRAAVILVVRAMPQPGRSVNVSLFDEDLVAALPDRGQEGDDQKPRRDGEQDAAERDSDRLPEDHRIYLAGQEHPRVAARDDERAPQVLLHQLAEHEAEQHRRRLEAELDERQPDDAEEADEHHV